MSQEQSNAGQEAPEVFESYLESQRVIIRVARDGERFTVTRLVWSDDAIGYIVAATDCFSRQEMEVLENHIYELVGRTG